MWSNIQITYCTVALFSHLLQYCHIWQNEKFSRAVRRSRTICPSGKIVQIGCETFTWSSSSVTIIHFHLHNPMRNWNEQASYIGLGNTLTRVKYHWLAHHIKRWASQKDHKHDSVVRMHWPASVLDSAESFAFWSGERSRDKIEDLELEAAPALTSDKTSLHLHFHSTRVS